MVSSKSLLYLLLVALGVFCLIADVLSHGTSYVSLHNKHGGKYEYKIAHGKHGHWSGHAHPHGYGGFGEKHHHY